MLSNARPLTVLCPAAESCARCGDDRCPGKRTSVDTPIKPCFGSRLSSSSRLVSNLSSSHSPQANTPSDLILQATDLLLAKLLLLLLLPYLRISKVCSVRHHIGPDCVGKVLWRH